MEEEEGKWWFVYMCVCKSTVLKGGWKKRQEQQSNNIFTDMPSFPLHYIISTQSPHQNLHSEQIVKYEWPLYITIDISPAVAFLHDNEDRLRT